MAVDHILSALTQTHPDSPLQNEEGDEILDRYTARAASFHAALTEHGGVTQPGTSRDIAEGTPNLDIGPGNHWFGVGGAPDYRTVPRGETARPQLIPRAPETVISSKQFSPVDALGHVLAVEGHNIERSRQPDARRLPAVYAGGWEENGNAVLDHSLALPDKDAALRMARDVGERAVWDAENMQELDPQTGNALS